MNAFGFTLVAIAPRLVALLSAFCRCQCILFGDRRLYSALLIFPSAMLSISCCIRFTEL
ncbi:hypothetical protein [Microcoleus sp. FACHB-1515]|uniref:hypothetical protein n=1 Tax=Cyanophyceae TaxID=3028117 RepID=UPI001F54F8D1|nr:hypothetical protein [Microcoleus sp. FACHB-1515]